MPCLVMKSITLLSIDSLLSGNFGKLSLDLSCLRNFFTEFSVSPLRTPAQEVAFPCSRPISFSDNVLDTEGNIQFLKMGNRLELYTLFIFRERMGVHRYIIAKKSHV